MNALATISLSNETLYMQSEQSEVVMDIIKHSLITNNINPILLPPIIEALSKVNNGSGWGKVEVEIRNHQAWMCRGIDDRLLEINLGGGD